MLLLLFLSYIIIKMLNTICFRGPTRIEDDGSIKNFFFITRCSLLKEIYWNGNRERIEYQPSLINLYMYPYPKFNPLMLGAEGSYIHMYPYLFIPV